MDIEVTGVAKLGAAGEAMLCPTLVGMRGAGNAGGDDVALGQLVRGDLPDVADNDVGVGMLAAVLVRVGRLELEGADDLEVRIAGKRIGERAAAGEDIEDPERARVPAGAENAEGANARGDEEAGVGADDLQLAVFGETGEEPVGV